MPPSDVEPQHLSNTLYACAACKHWDSGVQKLLASVPLHDLQSFNGQDTTNLLLAWAVLDQLASQVGFTAQELSGARHAAAILLKEAASRPVNSFTREGLGQLRTAHLYAQQISMEGLPHGDVLQAAVE
jgi:hypothetical protein